MNRFFIFLFILVLTSSTCKASSILTLEQRVEMLEKDYNYMKRNLESKIKSLEANVTRLETQVTQQESLLSAMKREQVQSENVSRNKNPRQVALHRTCHEARAANGSLVSGMYWIDPDGRGVGDDPIHVFCDMKTGFTSVLHDTDMYLEVGNCGDPGCYSRNVTYSATMRQMNALSELSSECHQSIRYDCLDAPLTLHNVNYSWWNDKNGKPKYFWSGNSDSVHTCQCGIDRKCYESEKGVRCNCDSVLKSKLADNGIITNKEILPITRLNFGRTLLKSSFGAHTLGRFECSGQVSVVGMSKSCADLWQIGHSLSGLYSVMGTKQVETVYCDFTKLPKDLGFQNWIGFNDVKSLPVYFYVPRFSTSFIDTLHKPIPFEVMKINIGNAMNLASGIFTAPRSGTYFFSFSARVRFKSCVNSCFVSLGLHLNGNQIGGVFVEKKRAKNGDFGTFSFQSTINLQAGNKIWLQINDIMPRKMLTFDDSLNSNHFSGFLLEENLFHSR